MVTPLLRLGCLEPLRGTSDHRVHSVPTGLPPKKRRPVPRDLSVPRTKDLEDPGSSHVSSLSPDSQSVDLSPSSSPMGCEREGFGVGWRSFRGVRNKRVSSDYARDFHLILYETLRGTSGPCLQNSDLTCNLCIPIPGVVVSLTPASSAGIPLHQHLFFINILPKRFTN